MNALLGGIPEAAAPAADGSSPTNNKNNQITSLPVDMMRRGKYQPRSDMRTEALEELADSFQGVAKAFAIQAGREVRVIVEPQELDDSSALALASDIAETIQTEMQYPGQIKVTVIRETRSVEYAR